VKLVIDRRARDALHGTLLAEISSIGDIWIHLTADRPQQAERLRRQQEQNMRLLDDLEWTQESIHDRFQITMSTHSLRKTLERLYWITAAVLSDTTELQQQAVHQSTRTQQICSELLAQLTDEPPSPDRAKPCRCLPPDLIEDPRGSSPSDMA
jgi:hypothetical protein